MVMAKSSEERISVSMLVTQCEDTFRTHLQVDKVATVMLELEETGEVLSKAIRKHLQRCSKKGVVNQFLAVIKKLELPGFVIFLESLQQIGDSKHLTALTTVATHIPFLSLPTPPNDTFTAEAIVKLKRIHQVYFKTAQHLDLTDPEQTHLSDEIESLTLSGSLSILPGDSPQPITTTSLLSLKEPVHEKMTYIEPSTIYQPITKPLPQTSFDMPQVGGVAVTVRRGGAHLYSPVHGVTVSVPATAVPSHVKEFELRMSASLKCTIPFNPEYIPCSAIVSLTTDPVIDTFSDYVEVSMPHCAMNMKDSPEFYCVLSHTDGNLAFKEDDIDFTSHWWYLSFKTKHFTKYVCASKHKPVVPLRKQPDRLSKTKAKSLEHHSVPPELTKCVQSELQRSLSDPFPRSEYSPDAQFCLAMFTPRSKDTHVWKMVFLTCLDVPTGYAEMEQDALKLMGLEGIQSLDPGSQRISFTFKKDCSSIVFSPDRTSCNGWSITSLRKPAIISQADMLYQMVKPREDTSYAPHCLPYAVEKGSDAASILHQEFIIKGVIACYSDQIDQHDVSFTLIAESAASRPLVSAGLSFGIIEDLYLPTSKFLGAIRGEISPNEVYLSPDNPETMTILAELSFCIMSEWSTIAKCLSLQNYEIENLEVSYMSQQQEASFQMMIKWLRSSVVSHSNLQCLLDALKKIGVAVHIQKLAQEVHHLKERRFHHLPRSVVDNLSRRIASRWKFVGRLLGMTETDINQAALEGGTGTEGYNKIVEQTVTMLELWGSRFGYSATLSKLKTVIHAIHEHSNHHLWDAIDFISKLLKSEEYNG